MTENSIEQGNSVDWDAELQRLAEVREDHDQINKWLDYVKRLEATDPEQAEKFKHQLRELAQQLQSARSEMSEIGARLTEAAEAAKPTQEKIEE